MKKLLFFAMAGMLMITGCGSKNTVIKVKDDPRYEIKYTIGILESDQSSTINEATKGFVKYLRDNGWKEGMNVKIDIQNAESDANKAKTIADKFVSNKVDIIFANGSTSAVSALSATKDIPIVFSSIPDPVGDGLVEALDKPGTNITGTVAYDPSAAQMTIDFMTTKISSKKIGVIYTAGNENSILQEKAIEEYAAANNASVVTATVTSPEEVQQVTESLVGKVDSFYIPNDPTVVSVFDSVVSVANDKKIPLFVSDLELLKKGAVAAGGFDYFDLGYQTGLIALEIINGGKKTTDFPVELPNRLILRINKKGVTNQGVTYDPEWENEAEVIDGE
ncbi:MAG TPA: ABC transporter substrate-binding protein [Pseudoneobacillus sp.]|nr:ABC transporter substrate-binding protein [Pseudoneobacillus sp.]